MTTNLIAVGNTDTMFYPVKDAEDWRQMQEWFEGETICIWSLTIPAGQWLPAADISLDGTALVEIDEEECYFDAGGGPDFVPRAWERVLVFAPGMTRVQISSMPAADEEFGDWSPHLKGGGF